MKYIYSFLFLVVFLSACKTGAVTINSGEKAFEQKKFVLASDLLKKEISKETDLYKKIEKLQLLAEAYDQMNKPEAKVDALQQIADLDANPQYLFDLGKAQMMNENYAEALATFTQYQDLSNDIFNSSGPIKHCEEVLAFDQTRSNVKIENIEAINSNADDYAARLYKDGALVFTSSRASSIGDNTQPWDNSKSSDLFLAEKNKNTWSSPKSFSDILNTEMAEGIATFSKDFETVCFTRCDFLEFGNSYCRIFKAEADGDVWYEAELEPIFSDSVNIGQPHLSNDGQRLYFSSDAPFGYGGNDIYFMTLDGTSWGQPVNAGFSINTEKDELFPTTDSKGNLYYSSDGKGGKGGLDIFKATPDKFAFSNSVNLPYPINSGADDHSFIYLKEANPNSDDKVIEQGVFSSSRKSGKGKDDIYVYEKLFINLYALDLTVFENNLKNPEDSESEVLGLKPLEAAIVLMKGQEKITPVNGNLIFDLEAETDYKILVSKTNYFNKSIQFSTKGLKSKDSLVITLFEEVTLEKIFPEKEIVIPNIYYDYDKATLREESLPVLDKLVSFFEENNDLKIEIGSHTDSRGSDKYNADLSQRRAQSVVDYFIAKGVPTSQLSAKGYGETKITNRCTNGVECSEDEHQKNRRTTFRVISADGVLDSE